jgi:hypothetical protein
MPINHGRIEVSYNVQTVVDAKNCLIVNFENANTNDRKELSGLAMEANTRTRLSATRHQHAKVVR